LTSLKSGGLDVITLANNHALDHGPATLVETIANAREAGLVVVGAGSNVGEAFRPAFVDAGGQRIAFVGLSMVVPAGWAATANRPGVASAYDQGRALDAVHRASAQADAVVVLIHWGTELARCPSAAQVKLANALHGAGALVVAGAHPHVLQGIEARSDRVTAYSLGNFVWYHNQPPSDTTGILDITVDAGRVETEFRPARIGANGRPALLNGDAANAVRAAAMGSSCWRG
jgi:poly-gamma-glutamate synthesis protein (capsule biosynthesis protein)